MQAFQQLSLREKLIVIIAGVVLLALSLHAFIWEPINLESVELKETLEQEKEDLTWIQNNVHLIKPSTSKTKAINGSFVSWLDLSVKNLQLKKHLKRIKPRGDKEVKLWIEEGDVKQLIRFLSYLSQYNVTINSIKMTALDKKGLVDANMILVRP